MKTLKAGGMLDTLENWIPETALFWSTGMILGALFIFFNNGFKGEVGDNVWSLYWAFDYVNNGIAVDRFRGDGLANLTITGITPALIYGHILNLVGWTQPRALVISTLFVLGAQFIWIKILQDLGFKKATIFVFITVGLLLDAYFETAHKSRTDAFVFFFISLSFLMFIRKKYFLAGLAAMIGAEGHPMGVTAFFYMLGYFIPNRKEILKDHKIKPFLLFAAGIAVGVGWYLFLHLPHLTATSTDTLQRGTDSSQSVYTTYSYLYEYFEGGKYGRHLPGLAFILLTFYLGIKSKYYRINPSAYWISGMVILSSILARRGNYNYAILGFPALLIIMCDTMERNKKIKTTLLFFLLLSLPQFAYLVYEEQKRPPYRAYIETTKNNLPKNIETPVLGSPYEFFATRDRQFFESRKLLLNPDFRPEQFYLIVEYDGRRTGYPEKYEDDYSAELVKIFDNHGEEFSIYLMDRLNETD